jgi:SAM-dependent methyltransferase
MEISRNCPICDNNTITHLRKYKNKHKSFDNLNLYQCNNCNFVFVNPMPTEAILNEFNNTYFDSAHGGFNLNKTAVAFFSGISKIRYVYLQKYLKKNSINEIFNVLEVGPGKGFFAENYLNHNKSHKYFVLESDQSCHDSLLKIGTNILDFDTYINMNLKFDLVVISHVLEHVSNPIEFLKLMTLKLREGGVLFIDVPCLDYLHKELDEPHLLFFDKNPMIILLEKIHFNKIETNYFGQQIDNLVNNSKLNLYLQYFRSKLISKGLPFLFSKSSKDLRVLNSSLERAVMIPHKAHIESDKPAWWLRAIGSKK